MNGEQKVTAGHRQRLAVVYLRQSSLAGMVHNLRRHYHLSTAQPFHENEITVAHAAAALQVSRGTLYYWIGQGQLPARRVGQHLAIEWTPNIEAECRHRAATSPHQNSKHQRRRAL